MSYDKPNHVYFSNRANCYLELKQFDECINDCDIAIDLNQDYAKSWFRKAVALTYLQKLDEAIKTFNKGFELDPDN